MKNFSGGFSYAFPCFLLDAIALCQKEVTRKRSMSIKKANLVSFSFLVGAMNLSLLLSCSLALSLSPSLMLSLNNLNTSRKVSVAVLKYFYIFKRVNMLFTDNTVTLRHF